jgi:uncharacterized membrane protein YfcA
LNTLEFTAVVALGSLVAGFLGSLTGLGGGIVIVPLLTLVFGVDNFAATLAPKRAPTVVAISRNIPILILL